MSPSSSTTLIAVAGSALLVAAAAAAPIFLNRSSQQDKTTKSSAEIDEIDDIDDEDVITPEDVTKIFDALFVHMQGVLSQLGQQIQQIQMSGQQIAEKQLRQILKSEFERALLAQQSKVFEENDVDEDCLEEATWEFLAKPDEYPQVKKSVERFQKLYENVTGESVVSKNPSGSGGGDDSDAKKSESEELLTKSKLIEAAQVYFDALTKAMASIVESFKEKGLNLYDPMVAQQLQMQFAAVANDAGEKALGNIGITQDVFRSSIEKHANDPEVGRALGMLQMKQQQELMALGVPAM